MTAVSDLVASGTCLLLDFDGPICSVFSGFSNRDAAKILAAQLDSVPMDIAATIDPFDVLHFAAELGQEIATQAERQFTALESRAVQCAAPTSDAHAVIRTAADSGYVVGIVSNNSVTAIRAYLDLHQLNDAVHGVFARTSANMSQLKPSPFLLNLAAVTLNVLPEQCVFVGDSTTDIEAARLADIPVIAFANKPDKVARFAGLSPDAIITAMTEISSALPD